MIYKNDERFYLTKSPLFDELKKAFPEIERKETVYIEMLPSMRNIVETDKGRKETLWPEKISLLRFASMESGEKQEYCIQRTTPTKRPDGTLKFNKSEMTRIFTSSTNPIHGFSTDSDSVYNELEELFLMYFFSPELEGGKNCKDSSKARWRIKNEARDAEKAMNKDIDTARAVMAISGADIDKLAAMYEFVEGGRLTPAQMNISALKPQFISQVKSSDVKLYKVLEFIDGQVKGDSLVSVVQEAIERGILIPSADGNDVVIKTKKEEKVFLEGVSIEDTDAIATFLSKNGSKKGTIMQQLKA